MAAGGCPPGRHGRGKSRLPPSARVAPPEVRAEPEKCGWKRAGNPRVLREAELEITTALAPSFWCVSGFVFIFFFFLGFIFFFFF